MPSRFFSRRPSHATVVAYLALFVAVTSGTAAALQGKNTVDSGDIINEEVTSKDLDKAPAAVTTGAIRDDAVNGAKVANDSLTGADVINESLAGTDIENHSITTDDVNESSLTQVPSALLGGMGRSTQAVANCDPDSATFITCVSTTLTLPAQSRVLVIAAVRALDQDQSGSESGGGGFCALASTVTGTLPGGVRSMSVAEDAQDTMTLVAVSAVQSAGSNTFVLDCNEPSNLFPIYYNEAQISAVALSPG